MDDCCSATLLGWSTYLLLWLFVAYCFLGVVVETLFCLVREGVLESRAGVLYLPLRPMYGIGGVASTLLLDRFTAQPVVVFLGGVLICSVVEYVAGSICDLLFGTLAWDYRDRLLQLHGKICLQYSCYWGLLAGLAVYVLTPVITASIGRLDPGTGVPVLLAMSVLGLLSAVLTVASWVRTRHRIAAMRLRPDGPGAGRASLIGRLIDRLAPDPVVINTFPRTRLARDLMELTGRQRSWIRMPGARPRRIAAGTSRRPRDHREEVGLARLIGLRADVLDLQCVVVGQQPGFLAKPVPAPAEPAVVLGAHRGRGKPGGPFGRHVEDGQGRAPGVRAVAISPPPGSRPTR